MRKINYMIGTALVLFSLIAMSSCSTKDLDPTLNQDKELNSALSKVDNLKSLLYGAYSKLTDAGYYGRDMIINSEVRTDNCYSNGKSGRFTTSSEMKYNSNSGFMWDNAYDVIAAANTVINADLENLEGDKGRAKNLQAQAYTIRAMAHFDLLAMYGQQNAGGTLGIPYLTEATTASSPEEAYHPKRNTVNEVRDMVFKDLDKAYSLFTASDAVQFDDPGNKEFISRYAAKAYEARYALYFGMWAKAEAAASIVINSGAYSVVSESGYVGSWATKMNGNSIFELAFNASDNRGINGLAYIYRRPAGGGDSDGYGDVSAHDNVVDLYQDEDVRLDIIGYQNTAGATRTINLHKYGNMNGDDNVPLIRIEEVILTQAEALFELGRTNEALASLNAVVTQRGIPAYTAVTKNGILDERRRELIFEGFRFNDLMRNKMSALKAITTGASEEVPYGDHRLAWPIPQQEMDANAHMVQNDGY